MDTEIEKVKMLHISETVELPALPFKIKSNSKTVRKWLFNICHGNKPGTAISEFEIDLLFLQNSRTYIAYLSGVNIDWVDCSNSFRHISFEPSEMYFKFSKDKYKNTGLEEMQQIFKRQIVAFMMKKTFQYSFLAKANIRIAFSGELIWTKAG